MGLGRDTFRKIIASSAEGESPAFAFAGKAISIALGKVARSMFDIDVAIDGAESGYCPQPELLRAAPSPGLIYLIEAGPNEKGLVWLDPLLVNALVELQTRAPDKSVLREARQPTLIDATLCGEFLSPLLQGFSGELNALLGETVVPKYKITRHEADARQLAYAIEPCAFGWLGGRIDFQNGLRGGGFRLALPQHAWLHPSDKTDGPRDPVWDRWLLENLLGAAYKMDAIVEVLEMPLSKALALQAGDILPISPAALSDIRLVAPNGRTVFEGRLGQVKAKKAVCLTGSPLVPGFAWEPAKLTKSPEDT